MSAQFKVFYDNASATQEQLDEIETIVVEQEIDHVWEAKIKIPVCMTNKGEWESEKVPKNQTFTRARIEIRVGAGDFVPLIDGQVVRSDCKRSSTPGKSTVTLVVHDDSRILHRESELEPHENLTSASRLARDIFLSANFGTIPDIDVTPDFPDNPAGMIFQRGTKMKLLRSLARRHRNFYAYVLPGEKPGKSIGCFKKLPTQPDTSLPELVMFGEGRNLAEFNVTENALAPAEFTGSTMSLRDKSITTVTKSYLDADLLSDEASIKTGDENIAKKRLSPGQNDSVDLEAAVAGAASRSGYSLEADGEVLPFCYRGVLTPYRVVRVRLSNSRFSTNYVIFKVTHTISHSEYTQSFSVKGNAVSTAKGATGAGNIF